MILDFDGKNGDVINISGVSGLSYQSLMNKATSSSDGVKLNISEDSSVLVRGTKVSDFQPDDFVFS